jgi:hypothetical protein
MCRHPRFLCNTQFCFPLSSLLLSKSRYWIVSSVQRCNSVGSVCVPTVWETRVQFPSRLFFSNRQVCNSYEGHKSVISFSSFCVYLYSFFLHSHSRTRGTQLVSQLLLIQDCLHQTQIMPGILKFKVCLLLH